MLQFPLFPTVCLALATLLLSCTERHSSSQETASTDISSSTGTEFRLEPLWTRIGDSYGEVDVENVTESVESAELSPDGRYIVSGAKKGYEVTVWEAETGEKVWEKKMDEETEAVAFSRDGRYVAVGGEYNAVYIFEAIDGTEVKRLPVEASLDGMRFSHKGDLLVAGDELGQIHVWRTSDWQKTHTLIQGEDEGARDGAPGKHADVNSIDFTQDDQYMASAGRNQVVKIWKVADGSEVRTLEGHTGTVKTTRISPDGRLVVAGAGNGSGARVWEFATGRQVAHIPANAGITEAVEFTPDGKYLVVGGNEGEGRKGAKIENPGFENADGMGAIRVYRVPQNLDEPFEMVLEHPVFRQEYFHFTKVGKRMVSSHEDGTLRLWKVVREDQPGEPAARK